MKSILSLDEIPIVEQWEALEKGKKPFETIGDFVANDFRNAQIFKKLGIDFCCGGKKTLEEVCNAKGIDIQTLKAKLVEMQTRGKGDTINYDSWDIGFLSDYIINTHHVYVKESLPFILELASKVAMAHGQNHPEVIEVHVILNKLSSDFKSHMIKEESIVFPAIKKLVAIDKMQNELSKESSTEIHLPTEDLETEHEQAGDYMKLIRKITSNYTLPKNACASFTILYKKLQEFENDLFKHVHLENNILFPKALKREKELKMQKC